MITLDAIRTTAAQHPDRTALEHGDRTLPWDAYERAVAGLVPRLAPLVPEEDATAVVLADASIPVFVLTSAFATLGIPWVAIDPARPRDIRDAQSGMIAPAVIVSDGDDGDLHLRITRTGEDVALTALSSGLPGAAAPTRRPFRALGFTSGTTGVPKLVLRSQPSETRRNRMFIERFGFDQDDRFLLCLPLSHASGHGWARTFLTAGGTVVIGSPDPEDIAARLLDDGITASLVVPPVLTAAIDRIRERHGRARVPNRLRFLLTGGRHVSPALVGRTMQTLGPVLHAYYGTTETGVNAIAEPTDLLADPRTAGSATDGSSIRIVDGDGREAPPGSVGRVAIASFMNAGACGSGPIPTVSIDGRPHTLTADVGRVLPDGTLRILGRANDLVDAAACGDLVGFEEDLRLLGGVTDAAVMLDPAGSVVEVFLASDRLGADGFDTALLRYLAVRVGIQRGVTLPIAVHPVPRLLFNATGKFDVAATRALVAPIRFESMERNPA